MSNDRVLTLRSRLSKTSSLVHLFMPVLATCFAVSAQASDDSCPRRRQLSIDDAKTEICYAKATESWVSPRCLEERESPCGALALVKKASNSDSLFDEGKLKDGKNPSNVLCEKLGGSVLIARLPSGSEATFCRASDKSIVDCNSLYNQYPKK